MKSTAKSNKPIVTITMQASECIVSLTLLPRALSIFTWHGIKYFFLYSLALGNVWYSSTVDSLLLTPELSYLEPAKVSLNYMAWHCVGVFTDWITELTHRSTLFSDQLC